MALLLSHASALNPGNNLWFIPDRSHSQWTGKLDWYLNLIISRNESSSPQPILDPLNKILTATELPMSRSPIKNNAPIMYSSGRLLPNKWVILLPYTEDLNVWAQNLNQIWTGLEHVPFRVFLPKTVQSNQFQEIWEKYSDFTDYSCVLDK